MPAHYIIHRRLMIWSTIMSVAYSIYLTLIPAWFSDGRVRFQDGLKRIVDPFRRKPVLWKLGQ